ncbi:MAG: anthranilate phosphoribosyltransferase [Methylococcales bacterium]|jgi:anthranilate phosphoribosyltransferase|nr:anthranilate phosphoribosyltransferase [Methylococcales bacterium]MBT7444069.1 anthranilate phosphoribosyltransferase [Methylococcales bacterium]
MDMQTAVSQVIAGENLSESDMHAVMMTIMTGDATPAQIGGFLVGLRMKGETIDEITAAAKVMRELATSVAIGGEHIVDTCGTGGDGAKTFNISTASAFVVAAAGGQVAKHGNRSISSSSGSADVLEVLGVNLNTSPEQVSQCVQEIGVGFMFAPLFHGAMKHAIGPRKELGARTLFNVLGPLTNPAGAKRQVMGVYQQGLVEPIANVLQKLGSEHVMVVHSEDGMDELSISAGTWVSELNNGEVSSYTVNPEDVGLALAPVADLAVDTAEQSAALIQQIFSGSTENQAARDVVRINAGAAIYVAGLASSLAEGVEKATDVIDRGLAAEKVAQLVEKTQSYA